MTSPTLQVGNEIFIRNSSYGKLWGVKLLDDGSSHCDIQIDRYTTAGVFAETVATFDGSAGSLTLSGQARNASTAAQTTIDGNADTYVTGSRVAIPAIGMRVGMIYTCRIAVTKTAAGTAAAVYTVRIGTAGAVGDTSRLVFTADLAQTAAVSGGIITVMVVVNSVSATGVIAGGVGVAASAGLGSGSGAVSSAFDNSALGSASAPNYIGVSINPGASADWTVHSVAAEIMGPSSL